MRQAVPWLQQPQSALQPDGCRGRCTSLAHETASLSSWLHALSRSGPCLLSMHPASSYGVAVILVYHQLSLHGALAYVQVSHSSRHFTQTDYFFRAGKVPNNYFEVLASICECCNDPLLWQHLVPMWLSKVPAMPDTVDRSEPHALAGHWAITQ